MELKSTVITLNNLLRLNFDEEFSSFVLPIKTKLSIPSYQREYKWDKAKIKTFVDNVMVKSKFLGIITTEITDGDCLSVVDGQQRLTTTFLFLAQLYNACADEGETETQNEIRDLISFTKNGNTFFKLENESIETYLHFYTDENNRNRIKIELDPNKDIYKQAKKFREACAIIQAALVGRDYNVTLDTYKQRLVDCKMLLFAQKNTDNMQQGSSEEIYIDINEKAQRLDPEDIFKGHCFAICKTVTQQNQVKTLWRSTKKQFFDMDSIFKRTDMGVFLHFYLLAREATKRNRKDINKDLIVAGEHIITYYFETPTKVITLLKDIEKYQANLISFTTALKTINYNFSHIMTSMPQVVGNNRDRLKEIALIIDGIIHCNQNLFKLPLFNIINENYMQDADNKLTYKQFTSFIYLYYIYMFLFSKIGGSRKREDLPNDLIYQISSGEGYIIQFINEIIDYSNSFVLNNKAVSDDNTRKHLYTILDYLKVETQNTPAVQDDNLTIKLRLFPDTYNLEHLVVNKSHKINWQFADYNENDPVEGTEFTFTIDDFRTCEAWIKPNNCWANFIWIDSGFNRERLKNKDIINKLILLRGSAVSANPPNDNSYAKKHFHIETICQHIMSTDGFSDLLTAYHNHESRAVVLGRYRMFIDNYFTDENLDNLRAKFENKFISTLATLKNLVE